MSAAGVVCNVLCFRAATLVSVTYRTPQVEGKDESMEVGVLKAGYYA